MSKGRVWNKGKRNGGGGPPESSGSKAKANVNNNGNGNNTNISNRIPQQGGTSATGTSSGSIESRIDRVERVNRENWVVRPAWVKREKHENDGNVELKNGLEIGSRMIQNPSE